MWYPQRKVLGQGLEGEQRPCEKRTERQEEVPCTLTLEAAKPVLDGEKKETQITEVASQKGSPRQNANVRSLLRSVDGKK